MSNIIIPPQTFVARYLTSEPGKMITETSAVILSSNVEDGTNEAFITLVFLAQVYFTDDSSELQTINTSIKVVSPPDFSDFTITGDLNPFLPKANVSAAYDSTDPAYINITLTLDALTIDISGTSDVRVRVATGSF